MAIIYVRSTDGSDADSGATWALAKATVSGACAIAAAGDTIYVSHVHSESTAANVSWTSVGTQASPLKIICVNDGAAPPTALATTAVVATTGGSNISVSGHVYVYGITFNVGSGANTAVFSNSSSTIQTYEKCQVILVATGSASRIRVGSSVTSNSNAPLIKWINCDVKFAHASQVINTVGGAHFEWDGGSVLSGGTSPTILFGSGTGLDTNFIINGRGLDLSNLSSSVVITGIGTNRKLKLLKCKLPSGWSFDSLVSGTMGPIEEAWLINCDSGDTNYRLAYKNCFGTVRDETTIVRTGGANDGATAMSHKLVSDADAEFPHQTLVSPWIAKWNNTTGSAVTASLEFVHDSVGAGSGAKVMDDEAFGEFIYLGTSGFPLGSFITDAKGFTTSVRASVLATAANQADSSETWTTTGLTTPVKQKVSASFTPQEKGWVIGRMHVAKASKTIYLCPEMGIA